MPGLGSPALVNTSSPGEGVKLSTAKIPEHIDLWCDVSECFDPFGAPISGATYEEAVAEAIRLGWAHYADGVDLCPKHLIRRSGTVAWLIEQGIAHRPALLHDQPSADGGWAYLCGYSENVQGTSPTEVTDELPRPPRVCRLCSAMHQAAQR